MTTQVTQDVPNKKLIFVREFNAPVEKVWNAWTQSEYLDQWWAPKPWKARTKSMDFSEGGKWVYAMVGPDGTEMWALIEFLKIVNHKMYEAIDAFSDENGKISTEYPNMNWKNEFISTDKGTEVHIEVKFKSEADMETIVKMGVIEGFTAAHGNLDEVLAAI